MSEYTKAVKEKRISEKEVFLATFLVCVFGILLWGRAAVMNSSLLDVRALTGLREEVSNASALLAYVVRERWWPVPLLFVMSTTHLGNMTRYLMSAWYGMGIGVVLGTLLLRYGVRGLLLMLAVSLPHYLFYVSAFVFSLKLLGGLRVANRKFIVQMLIMEVMVLVGCVCETMVAPVLMGKIIKII